MELTALDGTNWTARTARVGFPILVEYAQRRRPITYKEWDAEIIRRGYGSHSFLTNYGRPAGASGDACAEYSDAHGIAVPLINLIVVNEREGLPGKGANYHIRAFCRDFLHRKVDPNKLTKAEKRAIIRIAHDKIFDFPHWQTVLSAYGLRKARAKVAIKLGRKKRREPNPHRWSTGPESDAHKALKRRIVMNPKIVGLSAKLRGEEEHRLWSGDEIDVHFASSAVGVEVKAKSAKFDELHRGIFQCIKYRAVLRAQQIHRKEIPTAVCVLAIGGPLPDELKELARLFEIPWFDNLQR